jgi:diguanylate cyclase (GGDEF)-like protein
MAGSTRCEGVTTTVRGGAKRILEIAGSRFDESGRELIQLTIRDVTSYKRAENRLYRIHEELRQSIAELRQEAIRDPLTGLFNRRFLEEALTRDLHRAARRNAPVSLVMLDLDGFKELNDSYGHDAGDSLLRSFANLLRAQVRKGDICCRYGGDEFVLVLPDSRLADTEKRVEEICALLNRLELGCPNRGAAGVTVSAGIAEAGLHGLTPSELLRAADQALYAAKRNGRNRVCSACKSTSSAPSELKNRGRIVARDL